jgi:(1->4)-alpha-D-glucan 1-alpha-D-glucosylmutase
MPDITDTLRQLCSLCGIQTEYYDIWGNRREVSGASLRALLSAMGVGTESEAQITSALDEWRARQARRLLPPVSVTRENQQPLTVSLTVPERVSHERLSWRLVLETDEQQRGELMLSSLPKTGVVELPGERYALYSFKLAASLPIGYHDLEITIGSQQATSRLIVAPTSCFRPPGLGGSRRIWGPAVQLYAMRSRRDWGIGDFTVLGDLAEAFGKRGARIVGINPLHAPFLHDPDRASPYSPCSRLWLNVIYLDPEAIPEFKQCTKAMNRVAETNFQQRLNRLRKCDLVSYAEVVSAKREILEILYEYFRTEHLRGHTEYGTAFRAFQSQGGDSLRKLALYRALQEHFTAEDRNRWGWPVWPAAYRRPDSPEIAAYADENAERVEFFEYLQWHAQRQLAAAGQKARAAGVVLYGDLAVSSDPTGCDVWSHQDVYTTRASVGAPPDGFNLDGQNWGLPPLVPYRLTDHRYEPFIELLRQNMVQTGALRIDHVMSVMRLFWIPERAKPAEGAYIHYPLNDLLGILALESQRNQCLVVGEDLGTVPDELRSALPATGILSYKVLYFEKDHQNEFKPPSAYAPEALVTVTTHDLPTLWGYWRSADIEERARLGQYHSKKVYSEQLEERARDRVRLWSALQKQSLAPGEYSTAEPPTEMSQALCQAIHTYVARTPCHVMVFQLEDLLGQRDQVNLPGTVAERPNWRRRLSIELEQLIEDPRTHQLCAVLRQERGPAR